VFSCRDATDGYYVYIFTSEKPSNACESKILVYHFTKGKFEPFKIGNITFKDYLKECDESLYNNIVHN
jgi:hypothetical protein